MDLTESDINLKEKKVIKRVLEGDSRFFEVIVRRYNGYLYKIGRSYGFKHADVEDLMQETYLEAFSHLKDFEGRSKLKSWLASIMLHQCYHKRRRKSFTHEKTLNTDNEPELFSVLKKEKIDGNDTVQNHELKTILEQALLSIPEIYRLVFTLREMNGLSTSKTAELLSISKSNVKIRLSRAKKMLQEEIGKVYSPVELFEFHLSHCDRMTEKVMEGIR